MGVEERQGYLELARAKARTQEEPQEIARLKAEAEDARRLREQAALERDNLQSLPTDAIGTLWVALVAFIKKAF